MNTTYKPTPNLTYEIYDENIDHMRLFGSILSIILNTFILISFIRNYKTLRNYSNFILAIIILIGFKNNCILIIKRSLKSSINIESYILINCFIYLNNSNHFIFLLVIFIHR